MIDLYYRIHSIRKNGNLLKGFIYSIFYFFNRGIGFILMIILARYILPADYGKLSMYNTIFTVMGFMWAFASTSYSTVMYFEKGEDEYKKTFTSIHLLSFLSLVFFTIIVFFFHEKISIALDIPAGIVYYPAILTFVGMFVKMLQDYFRMKEKLSGFGLISCGGAVVDMASALIMVVALGYGWLGRVYSSFVGAFLFGAIAVFFFVKNRFFVFDFTKSRFKALLLFGLPLIPQSSTIWLTQGCDQYIINHFYSSYEVGVFCMALNLMGIIEMIGFSFNNSNSVTIYKILSDQDMTSSDKLRQLGKETRLILLTFIGLIGLLVAFVCLILPYIMPAYKECIPYFLILSVFGFLRCLYLLCCNFLYYFKTTNYLMYSIVIPSVIHLLLSLWLTRYSLYLTASVFILCQILTNWMVYRRTRELLSIHLSVKKM